MQGGPYRANELMREEVTAPFPPPHSPEQGFCFSLPEGAFPLPVFSAFPFLQPRGAEKQLHKEHVVLQ